MGRKKAVIVTDGRIYVLLSLSASDSTGFENFPAAADEIQYEY